MKKFCRLSKLQELIDFSFRNLAQILNYFLHDKVGIITVWFLNFDVVIKMFL